MNKRIEIKNAVLLKKKDETVETHWGTIICELCWSTLCELKRISLKQASRGIERGWISVL